MDEDPFTGARSVGILDFIFARTSRAPRNPSRAASVSAAEVLAMAREQDGRKQSSEQVGIPARWAFVWVVRLEHYADHPQCRVQFRKSLLSNKQGLERLIGKDLLAALEETASGDNPDDYRRLAEELSDVSWASWPL
jgi:hypothetical protein